MSKRNPCLLLFLILTYFTVHGQGTETFTNVPTASGTSYITRNWTGDDGSTWEATHSRTSSATFTASGQGIGINDDKADAYVESGTISGGIGNLTLTVKQIFSGSNSGSVTVYINGASVGTVPYNNTEEGITTTINGINQAGDFVIRVANDIGGSSGGGDNRVAIDNIIWTAYSPSTPTISFDLSASSETETDATFNTSIPITLSNHDTDVTISVTVDGSSTAETSDYTLNTSSLVFDADETLSVSLDINDDADSDNETIVLNIAVISGTADTGTSQHTITIIDDDLPQVVITEIMYNSSGTDDEWIEIFNANGASVDISNWTIDYGSSPTTFTFPESTTIADGEYITIACGSNGDGTFNNDNPFTPDQNNLSVTNANVATTSSTNYLGNSSGTITLKSSGGSTIDTVIYDDGDVSSTDGNGPSYEIIDVTASNTSTDSNWQASAFNGGLQKK